MRQALVDRLTLKDFTAFREADLRFARGLNVIVGENGTGKSQMLRLLYALLSGLSKRPGLDEGAPDRPAEVMTEALLDALKPDALIHLRRRGAGRRRTTARVTLSSGAGVIEISFDARSKSVKVHGQPTGWIGRKPVYMGPHELISLVPGYVSLADNYRLAFDGTWRYTCSQLELPLVRGEREKRALELLGPLETAMQGSVELDGGRFYLRLASGRMEMHLVPEGLRKLAMLARLIGNGSLLDPGYFFWDEPEASLNPKLIKLVAATILDLCRPGQLGQQVFVATHSLFLMRELDILLRAAGKDAPAARFFGFHVGDSGIEIAQGESVDGIGDITSLDQELDQARRYLATSAGR